MVDSFKQCEMCLNVSIPDLTKYGSVPTTKQLFKSMQSHLYTYFLHLSNSVSEKGGKIRLWQNTSLSEDASTKQYT